MKPTLILAMLALLAGCANSPLVADELGGRHATDNTLRCDVEIGGRCVQWSRTRSLASVRQEP